MNIRIPALIALGSLFGLGACSSNVSSPVTPSNESCSVQIDFGNANPPQTCASASGKAVSITVTMPNVATSGNYVLSVQTTSRMPVCIYMLPPPKHLTAASSLCNPTPRNVAGVGAPGGTATFLWPLGPQIAAGTYNVSVFDQSANGGVGAVLGATVLQLTR
jgi:hypothetical protein